jgi:hypothetical protein
VVRLKIGELVCGRQVRHRAIVVPSKTGRPVRLLAWLDRRGGTVDDYVFPSRIDHKSHMSTDNTRDWVTGIGLRREEYGTLSASHQGFDHHKATGNLRAVQILLHHQISRRRGGGRADAGGGYGALITRLLATARSRTALRPFKPFKAADVAPKTGRSDRRRVYAAWIADRRMW